MKHSWASALLAWLVVSTVWGAEQGLDKKMEALYRAKNDARKELVDCFKRIKNAATAEAEAPAIKKAAAKEFAIDVELMKLGRENPEAEKLTESVLDKLGSALTDVEVGYRKEMKRLSGKEELYKIVKQAMRIDAPEKPEPEDAAPVKPAKDEK